MIPTLYAAAFCISKGDKCVSFTLHLFTRPNSPNSLNLYPWDIPARPPVTALRTFFSTSVCAVQRSGHKMQGCSGLTLAGCQVPTKAALSLPLLNWAGGENKTKGSWVEIRTGRSLTNYRHRQNRLDLGKNQFNLLLVKSEQDNEK